MSLAVTAGFAYLNHYALRLPRNAGLLVIALLVTLAVRAADMFVPSLPLGTLLRKELHGFDLSTTLLNGFLPFLLFAGAIDVDAAALLERKWTVLALATVGVVLSTFAIAGGMFLIFRFVGLDVPVIYCLVFGALISPTDPVSVLSVLSGLAVPRRLQSLVAGESLFNDGIGIVLYALFLQQAGRGGGLDLPVLQMVLDFLREAVGGALLGLATGGLAFVATRGIDEYNIELMISLALVTGTYGIASAIGVSGPVAVVVAGLLMGSIGVKYAISGTTHDYLQKFWSLTDELINSLLFLLIGLEFAAIDLRPSYIVAAALAIPLALVVRGLSIAVAGVPLNLGAPRKLQAISLLTWSGLRGGIAVALALALPDSPYRGAMVAACYTVTLFTVIVQGLSLQRVALWLYPGTGHEHVS